MYCYKGKNMKKIILLLILILTLSISAIAQELPKNVCDASSLQIYMRQNFYYGADRVIPNYFEYFQAPAVLEFTRIGDCDDFSFYSWYYLRIMKYNPQKYLVILKDGEEIVGHAITVFKDVDKTYSVFSNQFLFKTLQLTELDAIKDIYPTWQIIFLWNPTKIGYLTVDEVYQNAQPILFIDLDTKIKYYFEKLKKKVLDYVDN